MFVLWKSLLISAEVFLLLLSGGTRAQNVPDVPCPEIFQYMSFGNSYIGIIKLSNIPLENIVVDAEFSQREPITTSFNGRLSLKDEVSKVQSSLERGQPISYRVDFPNPRILPKLMAIKVNGNVFCSGRGYDPPNTTFKVQHTFFPSKGTPLGRIIDNDDFTGTRTLELEPTRTEIFQTVPSLDSADFADNPFIRQLLRSKPRTTIYKIPVNSEQTKDRINWQFGPQITQSNPMVTQSQITLQQPGSAIQVPSTHTSANFGCGREGLTPFVVNGNDFPRGKFPWLVAIYIRVAADLKFKCGGSLISSRTIITAAHCFPATTFAADQVFVVLGRHNLFVSEAGSEQRDVASMSVHPHYNTSRISDADIALLHLSIPVSFSQYIRPICLWSQSTDPSLIVNQEGFIAGWGSDNNGNRVSSTAKMVSAKIVSEADCLRSSDLFSAITSSRSICAGNRDGSGPCMGDSGGGLMLYRSGVWILRGVLSIGSTVQSKCDLNEYVVYCDVAQHITWVRQNMLS